jgi:hypothetical protein
LLRFQSFGRAYPARDGIDIDDHLAVQDAVAVIEFGSVLMWEREAIVLVKVFLAINLIALTRIGIS